MTILAPSPSHLSPAASPIYGEAVLHEVGIGTGTKGKSEEGVWWGWLDLDLDLIHNAVAGMREWMGWERAGQAKVGSSSRGARRRSMGLLTVSTGARDQAVDEGEEMRDRGIGSGVDGWRGGVIRTEVKDGVEAREEMDQVVGMRWMMPAWRI
jgi:hypothetical protein